MPKRKKMGRPTKFNNRKKEKILHLASEGKTEREISEIIGICPRTLHYWKGQYTDFLHALKESKEQADALVEASLFRRATGYYHPEEKVFLTRFGEIVTHETIRHYPPDTTAAIFWLKNRKSKEWRDAHLIETPPNQPSLPVGKRSFEEFCEMAGYPAPFQKQIEMREFVFSNDGAILLLGSRGYGKTDYVTILGTAYSIYLDPTYTTLIVTKSDDRCSAILAEIVTACVKNGVQFDKENSREIRSKGLLGKDPSVAGLTIGSKGFRGRHPKRIIMDDPVTPDDESEATRKKAERLYDELLKLCKNIAVIGQPVHKYDLFEKLRPLIKKMEVPFGSIPELDADLEAQRLAGVSEESIQKSYFLKCVSESVTPFDGINYLDTFPKGDSAVAYIDPSFKGKDYTAITIIKGHFDGVAIQGHVHKKAWNHCIDEMAKQMKECNVKKVCIECNSLGDSAVIALRQALQGSGIGVMGRESTTNKHARIMAAGVYAGKIHLARTSDRLYIEHVTKYEYGSQFDDAPDSLATGLCWIGLVRG
jgi:transposase-like protein